ncbi:hypothetical protein LIER_11854 [Lithospermum erythrorhizon]|uniref:Integrase catalytic domain-containing protein n=1 Tax=Lithospermum erythrorhizon TaxID=34254 RepID=A0AAV3PR86_LITER
MCTHFTSFNNSCPKDFYPLPCPRRLVDGNAGHEREENEEVDQLSRLSITYYSELPEGVYVEMCNQPIYEEVSVRNMTSVGFEDWRISIIQYLKYKLLLADKSWRKYTKVGAEVILEPDRWPLRLLHQALGECPSTTRLHLDPSSKPNFFRIDLVGKLPKAKGGVEFVIVAVDYFSKWVEAVPLKNTRGKEVTHFLWKNILRRFGIPKILVSDNGPQFEGQVVANCCEKFGIKHRFAPVYYPQYPQSNGQVEVMNCIIFKEIKKNLIQSGKGGGSWVEELSTVLWSFRSTLNQATGEAPFSHVYGTEAVLPAEVGLPTYR